MKKTAIFLLVFVLVVFSSCTRNNDLPHNETTVNTISESTVAPVTELANENLLESTTVGTEENDIGGGSLGLSKYRSRYYSIPVFFGNIIKSDEYYPWYLEVMEYNANETNVMPMKLFIQEFGITREEFDKANLKYAKLIKAEDGLGGEPVMDPQDFANQEIFEVYNADIIYTFDDEIINNYYLSHDYPYCYEGDFENAVENGEYDTRSKEWVDVEAMEAEIIAKYGTTEYEARPKAKS